MAIRMRRGNEADFDPSKMLPGEWAVSTDTKYVRMCFSPGIVLRMATYEAFESDMAEMRKILSECQSIQTAVELIQQNVTNSELVIENYVKEAKQYRDEAEQFRNEAFSTTPEGYEDLVKNVSDNTVKIDTVLEKAGLKFDNTVKGSNIHLTDSAESNVVALELYGKTEQNAYTGKNLFHFPNAYYNGTGLTLTKNTDGTYLLNGSVTGNELRFLGSYSNTDKVITLKNGNYKCVTTINDTVINSDVTLTNGTTVKGYSGNNFAITDEWAISSLKISLPSDISNYSNAILKIMICEHNESDNFEPYVGGVPSPSPSYPQEIKSVKGKNLLDCRGLTAKTNKEVVFTPVYDTNGNLLYVNANGTATENAIFELRTEPIDKTDAYILNGCPSGGSTTSYKISYTERDASWNWLTASIDTGNGVLLTHKDNVGNASFKIEIAGGTVCNNLKFYPMMRLASIKDDTYVPYGLLRIKTHNANLVDMSNPVSITNMSYNDDKKTYVQTATDTSTGFLLYIRQLKAYNDTTDYKWVYDGNITTAQTISCTFTKLSGYNAIIIKHNGQAKDVGIFLDISHLKDGVTYYFKMNIVNATQGSIEFGEIIISETESDYIPYQSSEITLSEPIELNGFNGVYDVLTSEGVTRRFAQVVFDGSDDEAWSLITANGGNQFAISISDNGTREFMCTHFVNSGVTNWGNVPDGTYMVHPTIFTNIRFRYDAITSVADFKMWLTENPIKIVYELATPTTEELQTDFTALKTFYPETHVSNDADCDMSITYTADAKNYIDNKIALLTTAIYNNI